MRFFADAFNMEEEDDDIEVSNVVVDFEIIFGSGPSKFQENGFHTGFVNFLQYILFVFT